ncbi:MAG TPA: SgcJ/EcaC family oxidoreductase [Thermomicrobiales bacterium]|nr:SgcJ/EcaC family oxidoreductase [Thermomicrobiales bacterium]
MSRSDTTLDTTAIAGVERLHANLIAAWNNADATGYARLFTDEGSLVGFDGSMVDGRAAIESHLRAIFDHHQTASYVNQIRSVRMLGTSHALLRAVVGMIPPGGDDIMPEVNAVQSLVAAFTGNSWLIELFQNTPAAFHGRPEAQAALNAELRRLLPAAR